MSDVDAPYIARIPIPHGLFLPINAILRLPFRKKVIFPGVVNPSYGLKQPKCYVAYDIFQ